MSHSKNPNKNQISKLVDRNKKTKQDVNVDDLFSGLQNGDKASLSEAITLVESSNPRDFDWGRKLMKRCLPVSGNSIRIGITGVPGVGKSTFIESFGLYLVKQGKKVAVLAIDPSSEKSGGSILGDKTRMNQLSLDTNAFIRPTASGGSLGGVARRTRETMLLCEAAGYEIILVETVGVGQSETAVHSMTDFFMLLMLAGAGDELQGIKRGIMEMADSVVITKADSGNEKNATNAKAHYKSALHLFPVSESGWIPTVETCSSLESKGMEKIWMDIQSYENNTKNNGYFLHKRQQQQEYWLMESLKEKLLNDFFTQPEIQKALEKIREDVKSNQLNSYDAANQLIATYYHGKKNI